MQVRPPKTTAEVVDSFIDMILTEPPTEFMIYALQKPDDKGFHSRRRWDKVFKPALQPISLNAKVRKTNRVNHDKSCSCKLTVRYMVDQMSKAYENISADLTDENCQQLSRNLLFMTTHTLFHEICHVFVSYLTKGQESTPPKINGPTVRFDGNEGEAGRNIEYLVFGGTINWFHGPTSEARDDKDDEGKKGNEKEREKESTDEKSRDQARYRQVRWSNSSL